ncbi:MAG: GtrA family protein [Paracoccaceae bacterium]
MMRGTQFLRFLIVGSIGFIIDAGLLVLLVYRGIDPYWGRVISFACAVGVTFLLNRAWTFREIHSSGKTSQAMQYILTQIFGMAINYAIYASVIRTVGTAPIAALFGVAAGSMVALIFNYNVNRLWVFPARGR